MSAGTTGGPFARQMLIQTLTWQGAHVVAQMSIAAPRTESDADGRLTDDATIAEIERLTAVLVDAPTLDWSSCAQSSPRLAWTSAISHRPPRVPDRGSV
jgi:hypothetical protein